MKGQKILIEGNKAIVQDRNGQTVLTSNIEDIQALEDSLDKNTLIKVVMNQQEIREQTWRFPYARIWSLRKMVDMRLKEEFSADINLFFVLSNPIRDVPEKHITVKVSFFRNDKLLNMIDQMKGLGITVSKVHITGQTHNFQLQKRIREVTFLNNLYTGIRILQIVVILLILTALFCTGSLILLNQNNHKTQMDSQIPSDKIGLIRENSSLKKSLALSSSWDSSWQNPTYLVSRAGLNLPPGIRFHEVTWDSGSQKITIKAGALNVKSAMEFVESRKKEQSFKSVKLINVKEQPAGNVEFESQIETVQ